MKSRSMYPPPPLRPAGVSFCSALKQLAGKNGYTAIDKYPRDVKYQNFNQNRPEMLLISCNKKLQSGTLVNMCIIVHQDTSALHELHLE